MDVSSALSSLLSHGGYSQASLASLLKVDPSTISRWANNETEPRVQAQRLIQQIALSEGIESSSKDDSDSEIRQSFDAALKEIRESFHRRGKLSSRNAVLEELGKILFCQVSALKFGEADLVSLKKEFEGPELAREFVRKAHHLLRNYLPSSLEAELSQDHFEIRINDQEHQLIAEIVDALELVPWERFEEALSVDIFNELFGKFLADSFSQEKQLGQYLTPIEMVRLMVDLALNSLSDEAIDLLLDPEDCRQFGHILDPSCGVGTFLTEIIRALHPLVIKRHGLDQSKIWLRNFANEVLVGIDKSERMIKLATANLALSGCENVNLHCMSSLSREDNDDVLGRKLEGNVGLILTNPPFGAEFALPDIGQYRIYDQWTSTKPKKINSEVLFIERYLDWLNEDGQCLTVVPDSILTNRGIYSDLRKGMYDEIAVRSVISFPAETFSIAGTTAKTSILHFAKRVGAAEKTYFAICNHIGYRVITKGTHKVRQNIRQNDIPRVANCYLTGKDGDQCRWTPVRKDVRRWDATYHAYLSDVLVKRLERPRKSDVLLTDVADIATDRVDPRRSIGSFDYIEISDVDSLTSSVKSKEVNCEEAPSRARKQVCASDVLVSTVRPEQRKIGIVSSHDDGAVCTTGFVVLRPTKIDSLLLAELLKSDFVINQLLRNNIGIAYPAVDEACFAQVVLPIEFDQIEKLQNTATEVRSLQEELDSKSGNFRQMVANDIQAWNLD